MALFFSRKGNVFVFNVFEVIHILKFPCHWKKLTKCLEKLSCILLFEVFSVILNAVVKIEQNSDGNLRYTAKTKKDK